MKDHLNMFKALADLTRLRILRILSVKPLCVCEIMAVIEMAQSTTSQHLRILENAGFIDPIPGGTWTIYRLAPRTDVSKRLVEIVCEVKATPELKEDMQKARTIDRSRLKNCNIKKIGVSATKKRTPKG